MGDLVAVVTPFYATRENKRLELAPYTIRSLLKQDYQDFVQIVVDDGSTEDVECFLKEFGDSRIRYIRRERRNGDLKTSSNALNMGLNYSMDLNREVFSSNEASRLSAVTFLHSDDLLPMDSISRRQSALKPGFVYTDMLYFGENGKIKAVIKSDRGSKEDMFRKGTNVSFCNHTIFWSVDFLRQVREYTAQEFYQEGIFDPNITTWEDFDVSLSSIEAAVKNNFNVGHIKFNSVFYRVHSMGILGRANEDDYSYYNRMVREKHPSGTPNIQAKLNSNPPWSWFYFLPEDVKNVLRPVRDNVELALFKNTHYRTVKSLEEMATN